LYDYRVYDPIAGRWTQRDPLDYQDSENLYQFCGNNTIIYIDEYGKSGTITIHVNTSSRVILSSEFGQHAWIEYKYDNGEVVTYGTLIDVGITKNREKGIEGDVRRSRHINSFQEAFMFLEIGLKYMKFQTKLNLFIWEEWSYYNPCSDFAADVWCAATGERLSHRMWFKGPSNPATLAESIKKAEKNDKMSVEETHSYIKLKMSGL